jgi:hypothetical protein
VRPPEVVEVSKSHREVDRVNLDVFQTGRAKKFSEGIGLANVIVRARIMGRCLRIGCRDRLPEVPHGLHFATVIPNVCADRPAGTSSTHHLEDRGGWIWNVIQNEPGDYSVVAVSGHRESARVTDLEASARIGDEGLSGG